MTGRAKRDALRDPSRYAAAAPGRHRAMSEHVLDDSVVFVRTTAGQDAVFDDRGLDVVQRRLLCMVNGYTTLGDLIVRLSPQADWKAAALALLSRRLVNAPLEMSHADDGAALSPVAWDKPVDKQS